MKKVASVIFVLFALALFAPLASAEVIEFPSVGIALDVEAGWTYSDDGEGVGEVVGPDGSTMDVSRITTAGMDLEKFAVALARIQNGTKPKKTADQIYSYTIDDGKTMMQVYEGTAGSGDFLVIEMTAKSPESQKIMWLILASAKGI